MGSTNINKFCRLCMSALTDFTSVTLFDKQQQSAAVPHIVVEKLKQFVNLTVDPYDRLPPKVCQSCVVNLDFCIQFVDRCRRVANLMQIQTGSTENSVMDMETIHTELNSHYPYLYGSLNPASHAPDRNPQSVPFPHGFFFGQTSTLQNQAAQNTFPNSTIKVATTNNKSPKSNHRKILPKNMKNPEPNAISSCSEKKSKVENPTATGSNNPIMLTNNSNNVKTQIHNGQYMIPVTLMTPCKTCNSMITASKVQDIQNHTCSSERKKVRCTVVGCDKKFFTQITLRYHMNHYHKLSQSPKSKQTSSHHDVKVKSDGEIINKSQDVNKTDEKEAESSSSRQFVCSWPNCSKSYRTKSYLIEHRRIHTGDRPFTCSNCSRGFSRVTDVKKHQLLKVCHLNSK